MSLRKENPHKSWSRAAYVLMNKFHWTLDDVKRLPLSSFMELQEMMMWEAKEIEREKKRANH